MTIIKQHINIQTQPTKYAPEAPQEAPKEVLYHIMLYYVLLYYIILYYIIMLCYIILVHHNILCYVMLCYIITGGPPGGCPRGSAPAKRVLSPTGTRLFLASSSWRCSNFAVLRGMFPWSTRCPLS